MYKRQPDGSAVEPTYIGVDNSASYLGADGKKHIKAGTPAWLDKPAAEAFVMMNEKLARVGKQIQIASGDPSDGAINSAGRTHTQQRIATGLHAKPGNSVHEQGRGLDVRNFEDRDVRAALREYGFVQGNLSRPNVPILSLIHILVLNRFYKVPAESVSWYILPFALGNLLGPILLGHFFDSIGRKPMIMATYGLSGILLAITAVLFQYDMLLSLIHI